MKNKLGKVSNHFVSQLVFFLSSVLLFVLANPNIVVKTGIGFLGFFIYLPVLFLIHKSSLKTVWIYGLFYGVLSYGLYAYWLKNFHPLTLYIVCISYGIILAIVFFVLKLLENLFSNNAWIVQFLFILVYEYLKTLGFIGFSYGVSAYTMWRYIPLIQITDVIGVFGLNIIVIFPSFFIYKYITKKIRFFPAVMWTICLIFIFVYGVLDLKKGNTRNYAKVVAIQNNEDPWESGLSVYTENIKSLIELSQKALTENTDVDLVVWPETAVVPSILSNYYNGKDQKRYELVYNLLNYINSTETNFVIGNSNQSVYEDGRIERFNSAFVFESGNNVLPPEPEIYSKIKLVPFTEYFPMKNMFPKMYEKLLNGDVHMWDKGSEYKVFEINELHFGTPICFEDTFGFVCRKMVKNGARAFVNMSNDAWSKSLVCQNQHLSMAVFRSAENKVPSVRSTSSGQTCIINQHGKVVEMATPFTEAYVAGLIPIYDSTFKTSVYTKTGDFFGILEILIFAVILIIRFIQGIINTKLHKTGV